MNRYLFLYFLLLVLKPVGFAQPSQRLQPMYQALKAAADDTARVRVYNQFYKEWIVQDVSVAESIAYAGLQAAKQMKWPKAIAVFQSNIGGVLSDQGKYDSSIFYFKEALKTHLQNKDAFNAASTLNNMGSAASNIKSDYEAAAGYFFKALHIADSAGLKELHVVCLNNIANTYFLQDNFQKALVYAMQTDQLLRANPDQNWQGQNEKLLGNIYFKLSNRKSAQEHMQRALQLMKESGNKMGEASMLGNLSLLSDSNFAYIIGMRTKAADIWQQVNPSHLEARINLGNLGIAYADSAYKYGYQAGYSTAIQYALLKKSSQALTTAIQLFEESGELDNRSLFIGKLAEVAVMMKDYEKAYRYYRQYREIQDSVFSQEVKNKIAAAESQRVIDKKENDVQQARLALSNQRKMAFLLGVAVILMAAVVILLIRQNRMKQKVNLQLQQLNQELAQANEVKATFFGIVSHDLRGPVARVANLLHLQANHPELVPPNANQQAAGTIDALLEKMDEILLWSKGQMQQFAPQYEQVDVSALLGNLSQPYQQLAHIRFTLIVPPDASIITDVHYFGSLVQNITSNAVKALAGTPNATLIWEAKCTAGQLHLRIADNGPGMDAKTIEAFHSNNKVASGKHGLGFHIIRDMAKAIGYSIEVDSSPGKGTTIHIRS